MCELDQCRMCVSGGVYRRLTLMVPWQWEEREGCFDVFMLLSVYSQTGKQKAEQISN